MLAYIRKCLISGLLVWLPIWVTLLVFRFLIELFNRSLTLLPAQYQPEALFGYNIPGAGVIVVIVVVFVTGMIAANFIGGRIVAFGDGIVGRIPLVRTVYLGVKQVAETVFSPGGQSFRKVLLVEYPSPGIWTLAFQTGEVSPDIQSALGGEEMVSYFVPTTPNPTSGYLMMAPRSRVIEVDMSVDKALKFVISLGVVTPTGRVK